MRFNKRVVVFLSLFTVFIISFLLSISTGTVYFPFKEIIKNIWEEIIGESNHYNPIIMEVRLPRVILALLVGASLGGVGTIFQSLFMNPMADAYVIGISSGAALGAVCAIAFRLEVQFLGLSSIPIFAFIGGIITVGLVYSISYRGRHNSMLNLLLAGLAVNAFLSGLMSLLLLISNTTLHESIYWLMGGFSGRGWQHIRVIFPYFVVCTIVLSIYTRETNIMLLGDEQAQNLGVNVNQVRRILIIFSSLLTASAVSVSGVIGFVGLIIPHILRRIIGPDNRILFPASLLGGAILLMLSDLVARVAISPGEIPVGIVTSLIGAPFFLFLLKKKS
jgi:iron complex transport system permease protein